MPTSDLPAPRIFSDQTLIVGGSKRSRHRMGSLSGPAILTWLAISSDLTGSNAVIWNVYYSTALLTDLDDNTLTTQIEGIPAIVTGEFLRGVEGVNMNAPNITAILIPMAPLPAGSYNVYMVTANAASVTAAFQLACAFQPVPELG